jgi:hypothetical protein
VDADALEMARAELPPATTYGPETVAETVRLIAAHQGGAL